ncbi:putative SNAP25 homologous protein SNAP30 isoform X2 [Prunus yedoensis var. nudiflora]|nr:putative SNAP25 homologous protein SNAP30 isoform X2 [Prunus yedoensis var. nudiflora]
MFAMPWKAKKGKDISGPDFSAASAPKKSDPHQREKLGLAPIPKGRSAPATPPPDGSGALQQVEYEKAKQDDALSDLSNILGDLKGMAVDMGSELDRQNKTIDHLSDDVDELNSRMKGANQRTRRLLEK